MPVYFTKVSGVIRVAPDTTTVPRTFYSVNSRVEPDPTNSSVTIYLGGSSYTMKATDVIVNNQTARTLSEAVTLLTSLIGT